MCAWKNYNGWSQSQCLRTMTGQFVPYLHKSERGGEEDGGQGRGVLAWVLKKEMAVLEEGGAGLELVELVQAEWTQII